MKTYNANPGYEMDPQLLTHFNQHLDSLFGAYSKLLPFRMDFAYRKNTFSYRCACRYAMCAEMLRLINEVGEKLVGYAWVMEYTERKGLHIHFVGYLNGQSHRSSYLVSRLMGDIWRRVTEGDGYYHWCRFNKNYPVNINHVI
ncbi:inovirus Gp2 family protein, partial [Escherichia coli]|nr:inovirus Gp2 family protein [Escherichia coli]